MFFDKSKFLQKHKPSPESLLEYSFGELSALSDPNRRNRSKGIVTYFKGIEQGPDGQARTLWDVPSQSTRGVTYRVIVGVEIPKIGLFGVAKQKWNAAKLTTLLKELDVRVFCGCPDFLWGGSKYNLGSSGFLKGSLVPNQNAGHKGSGYSEQTVVTEPPDITDPDREHVLCKHCIAVSTNFAANALSIMKAARNYAVEIKINDEMGKAEDSGKMPLKKDVNFVDLNEDESKKITEAIVHGVEQINQEDSSLEKDQKPAEVVPEVPVGAPEVVEPAAVAEVPRELEKPPEGLEKSLVVSSPEAQVPGKDVPKSDSETSSVNAQNAGELPVPQKLEKNEPSPVENQKIDSDLNPVAPEVDSQVELEKQKASPNEILGITPEDDQDELMPPIK